MDRTGRIVRTGIIGIAANIVLSAFKAFIGIISNSVAITMDAVNNLSDAMSSIITIVGAKLSAKEPDKKHPFGYGRIEYMSAVVIGVIILYAGITSLIESVKTRNYTYSAVSRALTTILLDADLPPVRIESIADYENAFPYLRLLGFRKGSSALIRELEACASSPIINKLADYREESAMLDLDVTSARLYNQIVYQKFGTRLSDEYRRTIVIV